MDVSASAPGAEPLMAPVAAVKEADSGRSRSRSPARLNSKNIASPSGGAAQAMSPHPAAATVVSPAAARPAAASSSAGTSAGAATGIAGVPLPPAIVDLSRKLERSRSASRFPAVRSSSEWLPSHAAREAAMATVLLMTADQAADGA